MPTARAGRRSVEATPTRFVAGHLFLLRPALLMLFAVGAAGWAMPPLPGPDGRPKARITWPARVESPQAVRPPSDQPGKVLVLAVDFSDDPHTFEQAELQSVLFDSGRGSMSDYYLEASHGSLTLSGIVAGWYRLSQSYSYYLGDSFGVFGQFPRNSQGLVADLVARADPDVDFSQYDADRDGFVDGLLLVHAGPGAEETGNPQDIWSHEWQ